MEEKSSHITYKEYQKKLNKNPNEGIAIFVSAFFILLLLFLGIAKQISPDVDVTIGDDENVNSETVGIEKNAIDDRLKLLQQEDKSNNPQGDDEIFASELDEKVVIPDHKEKEDNFKDNTKNDTKVVAQPEKEATPKPSETAAPEPRPQNVVQPAPQGTATVSKVVVGYYSTKDQAEVAKGIIMESGMNIYPFVRAIGGAYTIQVGSYASREKAQSVVNDLLRNNYPARIISE